jgi:hypothetical protein
LSSYLLYNVWLIKLLWIYYIKCLLCRLSRFSIRNLNFNVVSFRFQNVGRRMTTFGVEFNSHLRATHKHGEYVPYIVSLCVDEINNRGNNNRILRFVYFKYQTEICCFRLHIQAWYTASWWCFQMTPQGLQNIIEEELIRLYFHLQDYNIKEFIEFVELNLKSRKCVR